MSQIILGQKHEIASLYNMGKAQKYIAGIIDVHKSIISREINLNADALSGDYRPKLAERKCSRKESNFIF